MTVRFLSNDEINRFEMITENDKLHNFISVKNDTNYIVNRYKRSFKHEFLIELIVDGKTYNVCYCDDSHCISKINVEVVKCKEVPKDKTGINLGKVKIKFEVNEACKHNVDNITIFVIDQDED